MNIAVVTPRFREPQAWLERCMESVRSQTFRCTHILVNDGGDQGPKSEASLQVISLPRAHGDYGDTPRAVGSISAISQGFDALLWLDADNWFSPEHVESMLQLHRDTGAVVITSGRMLHHKDGPALGPCYEVDGVNFVDTSCFMLTRPAFSLVAVWFLMDPKLHKLGDRVMWAQMKAQGYRHAHTGKPTVAYRTLFKVHYDHFGVEPPPDVKGQIAVD